MVNSNYSIHFRNLIALPNLLLVFKTTLFIEKEIHVWIDDEIPTLPRLQPWYIFCILKKVALSRD